MVLEIVGSIVGLIGLICAIWVIYDVWANQRGLDTVMRIVWTIAAIVFSIITAIVYFLVVKRSSANPSVLAHREAALLPVLTSPCS